MKNPANRPLRLAALKAMAPRQPCAGKTCSCNEYPKKQCEFRELASPKNILKMLDDADAVTEILELINNESMSEQSAMESLVTCVNLAAKALGREYDSSVEGAKACECGHLGGDHWVRDGRDYCKPCDDYCDGESAAVYVGDGAILCPPVLEEPIRALVKAMKKEEREL
jgi:hypothetical protein